MGSMIMLLASLFKEQEDVVIFCNSNDIENLTNGLNFVQESGSLSHKNEKLGATCYTIEGKSIYLIDKKNEYDFYN